ncbi:MAG: tRNA epoxyqueuosine(34) reductase QueG [Mariprofundaceae bacterium]
MNQPLAESVRQLAYKNGFDLCQFTRPKIPTLHTKALDKWLDDKHYADMAWMAEETRLERRKQPETMLDQVQTVICVAMRYAQPPYTLSQALQTNQHGIIASYAHGLDYHDVMKKRLKALALDLDQLMGQHDQRVFVDTAPVLEHALAAESGLGWIGKHSLSLHKQHGSWMLLAEIFTTANIARDAAASAHCGSCTACIDICPTQAIVEPYVVDANLCISYLTIEYKGFISHKLRRQMGNHIYGCDDCQSICPWNQKAISPPHDLLVIRGENILPELASLLLLDEEAFRLRFKKSPVKRTGRAAFLRNVCIAMGNSMHSGFIPALENALTDTESLIRGHAVWALGQLYQVSSHISNIERIEEIAKSEQDQDVLKEYDAIFKQLRG